MTGIFDGFDVPKSVVGGDLGSNAVGIFDFDLTV
jgi:hypothetical protein